MKDVQCMACLGSHNEHYITCPHCGSDSDAIIYLKSQGLDPWGVFDILSGRINFYRLTITVAKQVADILRLKHDKPN